MSTMGIFLSLMAINVNVKMTTAASNEVPGTFSWKIANVLGKVKGKSHITNDQIERSMPGKISVRILKDQFSLLFIFVFIFISINIFTIYFYIY